MIFVNKNKSAFTLIEFVIVAIISIAVFLGSLRAFKSVGRSIENEIKYVEKEQNEMVSGQLLLKDFSKASPSFDATVTRDQCGNKFFDLVESQTCKEIKDNDAWKSECSKDACFRRLEIGQETFDKKNPYQKVFSSITFMTEYYEQSSDAVLFTPSAMVRSNSRKDQPLRLANKEPKKTIEAILSGQKRASYWKSNSLLLFETTVSFPKPHVSGSKLSPLYLVGTMQENGSIITEGASDLQRLDLMGLRHPLMIPLPISLIEYLSRLPMEAGLAPLIRVRPIEFVKYGIIRENLNGKLVNNLYRWTTRGETISAQTPKTLMVKNIKKLRMFRRHISIPNIEFEIEIESNNQSL